MDLTSRLDGYLNHEIAYNQPIPILPVPKTLHDKKDTTLLEMAMKAFLKQRLYSRFHNFDKDNTHNKNHLNFDSSSVTQNSRFLSFRNQTNNITRKVLKRDNKLSVLHTDYDNLNNKPSSLGTKGQCKQRQKGVNLQAKRLSQISSSFDFKTKRSQQNESILTSHSKIKFKQFTSLHQSFNLKNNDKPVQNYEDQQHPETSFISAIDYYQKKKPQSLQKSQNSKIKLPEIVDKRKNITSKLQMPKSPKLFFKKQTQAQLFVKDQLWSFISKDNLNKAKRFKQNKLVQNKEYASSNLKSLDGIQQNKNSIILKNNEPLFNKQAFQTFTNNSKLSIPFFMQSVFSFFELLNKISDKSKKSDFESCLSEIFSQPDRAWCVAIFRFFDVNADGKIDSSDLFKIYNSLQQIIQLIKSLKSHANSEDKKSNLQSSMNQSIQSELTSKIRQRTEISQNESSLKIQKERAQIRQKIDKYSKQKTYESQRISQDYLLITNNLMTANLQNLKALQKFIQKLNLIIIQKDKPSNNYRDFNNPEIQQHQSQSKKISQVSYLEEALLKKKDLKISDLSLILEELFYQNSKTKKKVIDIDYKKLNIKLSSSYVQTFIATNHNEQTRGNREHLQSLKDNIKNKDNQNSQNSNMLQKNILPAIRYAEFYEEKFFLPLKNLFFQGLHANIIDCN